MTRTRTETLSRTVLTIRHCVVIAGGMPPAVHADPLHLPRRLCPVEAAVRGGAEHAVLEQCPAGTVIESA